MYSAECLQFIIWILVAEHSKPLNNSCVIAAFLTNFPHVQLVKVNSCLCPRALIRVWEYSSVYRDANRTWVREKGKSKSSAKKFVLRKLYQKPFLHCIGDLSRKSIKFRYSRKFTFSTTLAIDWFFVFIPMILRLRFSRNLLGTNLFAD